MDFTVSRIAPAQWQDWRWQMTHSLRQPQDLAATLSLTEREQSVIARVAARYPICVTPYYLSLARSPSLSDPILRQVVPSADELDCHKQGLADPLGEEEQSPVPALVHRHANRALVLLTNACATHCRHCMRKRRWGPPHCEIDQQQLDRAIAYLRNCPAIREVLLSGGDPLLLPVSRLERILTALLALNNVETVRIGSRLPAVLPQRFSLEFCQALGRHSPIWLATQFNHPFELTEEAAVACENLARVGIPLVNQTVLLRGVNDDDDVLAELFQGLLRLRVKPYYLFHGDPVGGTMHFRTGVRNGLELMRRLRTRISGLALPAFALDLPHGGGKIRLEPSSWESSTEDGDLLMRNDAGKLQPYPEETFATPQTPRETPARASEN